MNKGVMLVFFTAIISGVSIFLNKYAVAGIDSTIFTFLKNSSVALLLISLILAFGDYKELRKLSGKNWLMLTLVGLIGGSIPFILFFKGLQMSTGSIGSFIQKTMFVFVALIALFALKQKFEIKIIIPALLLLIGNFLILKMTNFHLNTGALLILIATIFWAGETVLSKNLLKTIKPSIVAFGRMFFGSIFILFFIAFSGKASLFFKLTSSQISWILVTVPFLFVYVITFYYGLKTVSATTATAILLVGSPVTSVLSLVFSGTSIGIGEAFGMFAIIVGAISMIWLVENNEKTTYTNSTA